MEVKRAIILTLLYIVPFLVIAGTPSLTGALLWFAYLAVSFILVGVVVLVGKMFFDLELVPWGLIILASPLLALPFGLIPGLWYVPTAVIFLVGLMGG